VDLLSDDGLPPRPGIGLVLDAAAVARFTIE
jgi:hypothetical protein